ncbi:hypothetical protein HUU53_02420 [Candidatus Micrarchaeota archaeon]|nr:hypothetical protein [Candidatus Micrarchaeota archaeon]
MKAQIELFALTKFAMIFFIFALSAILVSYGDREKSALCNSRAEFIAQGIGASFTQVINSPAEDERKIVPLETVLSSSSNDFARYNITIFNRAPDKKTLIITVKSNTQGCQGGASVGYPEENFELHYNDVGNRFSDNDNLNLTPSNTFSERSRYLILLKCSEKELTAGASVKHLFIEDCNAEKPSDCVLNFNDAFLTGLGKKCAFPDINSV